MKNQLNVWFGLIGFDIVFIRLIPKSLIDKIDIHEVGWVNSMQLEPISATFIFGMLFCGGMVFNYFRRVNRFTAYVISGVIFGGLLLPFTGIADVIRFWLFMSIYEKSNSLSLVMLLTLIERSIVMNLLIMKVLWG